MVLKKRICAALCAFVVAGSMLSSTPYDFNETVVTSAPSVMALTVDPVTYKGSNIGKHEYIGNWATTINSYLTEGANGYAYMRVQGGAAEGDLLVQYFDEDFHIEKEVKIPLDDASPIFGGFYSAGGYYYVLTGQNNDEEDNSREVFRVTKYNTDWVKQGSAGLNGANTTVPFDAGSARMDYDSATGYLVVRTSHEMYESSDGLHHQSNVTFMVDTKAMTIKDSFTNVGYDGVGYVSHSFNQFIKLDGNNIVAVDHGDAYPRSVALIKYPTDISTGRFLPYGNACSVKDMLAFPGGIGNNYTGATVGGFEISSSAYIVVGSSIDQSQFGSAKTKNIYLASVGKDLGDVYFKSITNYTESDGSVSNPYLVKLSDDRFLIMWTHDGKINYTEIDGSGTYNNGKIYTMEGSLSDCDPQVINGNVVWYTWSGSDIDYYQIDASDISKTKVTETDNGHFYIDSVKGDTLTRECEFCDASEEIKVQTELTVYFPENSYNNVPKATRHPEKQFRIYVESDTDVYDDTVVFEAADPSMVKVTNGYTSDVYLSGKWIRIESDHHFVVTPLKTGTLEFYLYPKNNPDLKKKYTYSVEIDHSWDKGKITTDPTCTEKGEMTYTCTEENCDETKKEPIDMIEHPWDKGVVTEPTCTEGGYTTYTCTVCKKQEVKDKTDPLGHDEVIVTDPATCTEDGTKTITCSRCDEYKKVEPITKLGHNIKTETVDSTCSELGNIREYCTRCDYEKNTPIAKKDHTYEDVRVEPTCTKEGSITPTCKVCGAVDEANIEVLEKIAHTWNSGKIDPAPTCTKDGVKTYTCTVCKTATKTETVDALGHKFEDTVIEPTCQSGGYTMHVCVRGDLTEMIDLTDPVPHQYEDVTEEPTCSKEGKATPTCKFCGHVDTDNIRVLEKVPHQYENVRVEPTCTKEGSVTPTCKFCGDVDTDNIKVLDKIPHPYEDVRVEPTCTKEGSVTPTCTVCGDVDTDNIEVLDKIPHLYEDVRVEPTCTEEGSVTPTCTVCGNVDTDNIEVLEKVPHQYEDVRVEPTCKEEGSVTPTCTVCGDVDTDNIEVLEKVPHQFKDTRVEPTCTEDGFEGVICEACGEANEDGIKVIPSLGGHKFEDVVVDATCEEDGSVTPTCTVCGEVDAENATVIEKLGHNYTVTSSKDATETEDGEKVYTCERCGKSYSETIPALGSSSENNGNTDNTGNDGNDTGNTGNTDNTGNSSGNGNTSTGNDNNDNVPNTGAASSAAAAMILAAAALTFRKGSSK